MVYVSTINMNCRTAWLLAAFVVLIPGSKAKLTVVPKNVAVVEGDVAIFNCTTNTNNNLLWRIINETLGSLSIIFTGNRFVQNYSDYCKVDNSTKGQFTLKVKTRQEIPLHYICEEAGAENAGADLVVLESNPRCAVVDDGRNLYSSVQMRCNVHYVGNWTPVMEWKIISAEETESTVDISSINTTTTNNVVNSVINITAHLSLNGCKLTCTTRFTDFSRSSNYSELSVGRTTWPVATNVPEYSFTWMSQTLHIVNESRSVLEIIVPILVAMFVVGGVFLLIRFITQRQKKYWISKLTPIPRTTVLTEQNGDHAENENHIINGETEVSHHEIDQPAAIVEANTSPTIPDVVEECGNEAELANSSSAAAKLRSKLGYVDMTGATKPKPKPKPIQRERTKSGYVTMDPQRKSNGPPKPPRATQLDQPIDPTTTDRAQRVSTPPKKPPRVSQSETTEYVQMNIARAYAAGVAPPSQNPMFSRVEVYASIDHTATVPPSTSKLS